MMRYAALPPVTKPGFRSQFRLDSGAFSWFCYGFLIILAVVVGGPRVASAAEPQLAHMVYFELKESTQANRDKLVDSCRDYLSGHEATVYFAAGVLAEDLDRDVNVKDFDVSLILVFRDKAAHAKYQTHPRHLKFIEENQSLWSGVRVFDSYIPVSGETEAPAR